MIATLNWTSSDTTVDVHAATMLHVTLRQAEPDDDGDIRVGVDFAVRAPTKGCDMLAVQLVYLDAEGAMLGSGDWRLYEDCELPGGKKTEVEDFSSYLRIGRERVIAGLEVWVTSIHTSPVEYRELWWGLTGPNKRGRYEGHVAVEVLSSESVPEVEMRILWVDPKGERVDKDTRFLSLSPGVQVLSGTFYAGEDPKDRSPRVSLHALHRRTVRAHGTLS